MAMHPNKAVKLLADYERNGYNAYKTLIDNGYSHLTADKCSKVVMERANQAVKTALKMDNEVSIQDTARTSLEIMGIDREKVIKQLETIAFQNKDYTNALKVLSILAKDIGLNLENSEQKSQPNINIVVEKVETSENP